MNTKGGVENQQILSTTASLGDVGIQRLVHPLTESANIYNFAL